MTGNSPTTTVNISTLVDDILDEIVRKSPAARGSLVFALDATLSREETWDRAVSLQVQMFNTAAAIGALDIKLIYFRGAEGAGAECRASNWLGNAPMLARFMTGIKCRGGITQWARVLEHTLRESDQRKINAAIFIGDCCEEPRVNLVPLARRLADQGIPVFVFQEGRNEEAEMIFREIAEVTKGAYCRFDESSSKQLGELLRAVAAFATGGVTALEAQGSTASRLLLGQIK